MSIVNKVEGMRVVDGALEHSYTLIMDAGSHNAIMSEVADKSKVVMEIGNKRYIEWSENMIVNMFVWDEKKESIKERIAQLKSCRIAEKMKAGLEGYLI